MKKILNIVFFGNETLSSGVVSDGHLLQELIHSEHNICSIVVHETVSQSRTYNEPAVMTIARQNGIPIHNPERVQDIVNELRAYAADIGILTAYGKLVPQSIIDIFPAGIVNIHPSLLPRYRGPTPIEQALLNGDTYTGVSLMALVKEMDAGPIYDQSKVEISTGMSKQALTDTLLTAGSALLLKHLPAIADGSLHPIPQDETQATFTKRLSKQDAALDFRKPAIQLIREIIAYYGWPKSYCILGNNLQVIVHDAVASTTTLDVGAVHTDGQKLYVGTATHALEIRSLQVVGKQKITAAEFLRGYRHRLTDRITY